MLTELLSTELTSFQRSDKTGILNNILKHSEGIFRHRCLSAEISVSEYTQESK